MCCILDSSLSTDDNFNSLKYLLIDFSGTLESWSHFLYLGFFVGSSKSQLGYKFWEKWFFLYMINDLIYKYII